MKVKETKSFKLILLLICIFLICLFGMQNKAFGAIISGTIVDENDNPIDSITVNYGTGNDSTSNGGGYSVEGSGTEITYSFTNGAKYDEVIEATSIIYEPEDINEEYNIVIVKPESGYEKETREIEQMLINCKMQNNKEIITYNDTDFEYKGERITSPHRKFSEDLYDNRCINLFIVIATENIPDMGNISKGGGSLWKRNIFLNTNPGVIENPKNMQVVHDMSFLKNYIKQYGDITESTEIDLKSSCDLRETYLKIVGIEEKNQTIKIKLRRKEEPAPVGDFVTGKVYLQEESNEKITTDKYGKKIEENITVELIKINDDGSSSSVGKNFINSDAAYGFNYPGEGTYKLKFEYNGQEFKPIENVDMSNILDSINTDNHAEENNDVRNSFNDKFKPIDNEKSIKIINWEDIIIYAETPEFYIEVPVGDEGDPDYDPPDPKYLNLVLEKREEFEFELINEINVVKVTLSDGQIYEDKSMDKIKDQLKMRQIIMDEELMHGATVEIEYLIKVISSGDLIKNDLIKNNPDYLNNKDAQIKVRTYIDYMNKRLNYNPDAKLLTEDRNNKDIWDAVSGDEYALETTLSRSDNGAKLVVSTTISSSLEDENLIWQNFAEVIEYRNNEGRRLKYYNATINDVDENNRNIPSNFDAGNFDEGEREELKTVNDTAIAEDVFIIPPFGGEYKGNVLGKMYELREKINNFRNNY